MDQFPDAVWNYSHAQINQTVAGQNVKTECIIATIEDEIDNMLCYLFGTTSNSRR